MNGVKRYAVYWMPEPLHPLWRTGCEWLGRDPAQAGAEGAVREATASARRYGFHATLKPPMQLGEGASESAFMQAVQACAAGVTRFAMPRLSIQWLGEFLALCPQDPVAAEHPLRRLADHCVRSLDPWRAVPTDDELVRRRAAAALTPAQIDTLNRWGYPYVFEHWRFHMTLSDSVPRGPVGDAVRERLLADARRCFTPALALPLACDSLSVFIEPSPGAPFVLLDRCPLAR